MSSGNNLQKDDLLSLEEALKFDRKTTREYYRSYINPGLVSALTLIDFDKQFVRAKDTYVWDAEGKQYLDFLGGYGSLNLGHNPDEVIAAINFVLERPNLLQASLNPLAAALAHNLAKITPGDLGRVFFCNSGTEAVEGALKLARAFKPERSTIVYCENSFHGKSFGSLSVTGREKYRKPFAPLLPGCEAVPYGDAEALEKKLASRDVAAFIAEPIQGEGGVIVPPEGYLSAARELCDRYGSLFIVDEIQTGLGRTGRMFACDYENVVPDIVCLAKSLGGGVMPVGAFITRPSIWDQVYGGMDKFAIHTSTFGGNTLAMAAGLAVLRVIIEKNLAKEAKIKGFYLKEKLIALQEKYNLVKDIRGKGLLIGLEFNQPVRGFLNRLTKGKVNELFGEYMGSLVASELINNYQVITAYTLNNPNVIRLEPPLTVSCEALDNVIAALGEILEHSFAGVMVNTVGTAIRAALGHGRNK